MIERTGLVEELQANRLKYARFQYVAPQDRLPRAPKPPVPVTSEESKRDPIPRSVLAVMRKFCKVYSEISGREFTIDMLRTPERSRDLAWPRHVCIMLASQITGMSTTPLGKAFGGRDHTTIMHALQTAPAHMLARRELLATYDAVTAAFEAKQ